MSKEELRKEFDEHYYCGSNNLFDWFYSQLEAKDGEIEHHAGLSYKNMKAVHKLQEKLKAADDVIKWCNKANANSDFNKALNHYKSLK